jgi:hypothetical protein
LHEAIVLSGGFQHYRNEVESRHDTLGANTVWGMARYSHRQGYHISYSFVFDRARRTGDLTATDNIVQTVHIGKAWKGHGGLTAAYGYLINDDLRVERSGEQYSVSGWVVPVEHLILRAGFDFDTDNVDSGRTLTGDREHAKYHLSAGYDVSNGSVRIKLENRHRSNDDIGSSADFVRASGDVSVFTNRHGELQASYAYGEGEYENSYGAFDYSEHVASADATSPEYHRLQAGCGGTYYRARQDVDVEAFTVRISGQFAIRPNVKLEVVYSAHNFDNLADPARPYTEYYTANVVELNLLYEL